MRSPPDNLVELLSQLQVCSREDVVACEPAVRRLSHDLPDFEMVWLDALVQQRSLTPWQVDILQSECPQAIRAGDYLKRDQLGNHLYLAESVRSGNAVTLHDLTSLASASSSRFLQHLMDQQERVDDVRHEAPHSIVLPRAVIDIRGGTRPANEFPDAPRFAGIVSDYVPGWTADELLIRGGRLPWQVVAEIGRQLLSALRWMEAHNFVHGDIVPGNVRVAPDGHTRLVAPFAARWKQPLVTFTANLTLREIQTTAPELVGTGRAPDSRSELYSVGCVLWQLLTARPVFLAADPVNRLLKAQQHDVADVRTLVPDCPDWMGRLIHSLTRRVPDLRPTSCGQAADTWVYHVADRLRHTRQLTKKLPDRSRHLLPTQGSARRRLASRTPAVAVSAVVLLTLVAWGLYPDLLPHTLRLPTPVVSQDEASPPQLDRNPPHNVTPPLTGPQPLPVPDVAGVILLQSGEVYSASPRSFTGVMHIETTAAAPAIIKLNSGIAWQLKAQQIVVNNVQIDCDNAPQSPGRAVLCECDVLSLSHCRISTPNGANTNTGVHWQPLGKVTSVVTVSDCVFDGPGYGLRLSRPPGRCLLTNSLFTTRGSVIRCDLADSAHMDPHIHVHHVTQAGGRSFLDLVITSTEVTAARCRVTCGESVLASEGTLVRIAGPKQWSSENVRVDFLLPERGNPTIVPPDVSQAAVLDYSLKSLVVLPDHQIVSESLLVAAPTFAGNPDDAALAAYQLVDYAGPKLSPTLPGVHIERLPEDFRSTHGTNSQLP